MENTYMYTYDSLTANSSFSRSYVPTTRFSISSSVRLPSSEIDFRTGMLKPDHTRRRTQAIRLEMEWNARQQQAICQSIEKETAKNGVQISVRAFILIVVSVILVLGMSLIYQTGRIAQINHEMERTERTILDYESLNQELRTEIENNSSDNVIMTAARDRLGMVRRTEKEAIHLTAPSTRPASYETVETVQNVSSSVGAEGASVDPFYYAGY